MTLKRGRRTAEWPPHEAIDVDSFLESCLYNGVDVEATTDSLLSQRFAWLSSHAAVTSSNKQAKLYTDDVEREQIWQQINQHVEGTFGKLNKVLKKQCGAIQQQVAQENEEVEEEEMEDDDGFDMDEDNEEGEGPSGLQDEMESDEEAGEDADAVEEEGENKPQTHFDQIHQKELERINELQEANLTEKSWQLAGEASKTDRPVNSTVENHLVYERATKLDPVITEDVTEKIEQLVRDRIHNKAFDDVMRKERKEEKDTTYRKKLVLDQEKSKQSLAAVYEQEFMQSTANVAKASADDEEEENPEHKEIRTMMTDLFDSLSKLTSFTFSHDKLAKSVSITTNKITPGHTAKISGK